MLKGSGQLGSRAPYSARYLVLLTVAAALAIALISCSSQPAAPAQPSSPQTAPAQAAPPKAEKQIVSIMGSPGLHQELWKRWTAMVLEDTKGQIEIKYEPLGYSPAYAKIKTEKEADHHTIDLFYGDAPYPYMLANEGLLEPLPYDKMPTTKELWEVARGKYMIEVFHPNWGMIGFNTKFMKALDIAQPGSWEEFANPKWKGKLGWPDLRTFTSELPAIVAVYGEDKWLDYMKRVDKNVSNYYSRWIDARTANQKGDIWLTVHSADTVFIGAVTDKAPMSSVPISNPKPGWVAVPIGTSLVKDAPNREAAIKVLDLTSGAKYTKVNIDIGLALPNNPKNYPNPMADQIMEANNMKSIGITKWEDTMNFALPIDWFDFAKKVDGYVKAWDEEVLKKR